MVGSLTDRPKKVRRNIETTLERIARVLGVPITAFYDSGFQRHDGSAELLDLWVATESEADRAIVIDVPWQGITRLKRATQPTPRGPRS